MSHAENPEGKLTAERARHGYRPHLVIIDEVQNLLWVTRGGCWLDPSAPQAADAP
jgi:hypothetical protein